MSGLLSYAIGDVHGEDALLADLHARIAAHRRGRPARIVHLGDYIDRGPDSRAVIDRVMALQADPPAGVEVVALRGNHEQMLLEAVVEPARERHWLANGGLAALASYGVPGAEHPPEDWRDALPAEHLLWLAGLPSLAWYPAEGLAFVHAGLDPARFPDCPDEVRLWTRSKTFFTPETWPDRPELAPLRCVVHGHTALGVPVPDITPRRINVDTGAVYGGPLSAVVLSADPSAEVEVLQAYRRRG